MARPVTYRIVTRRDGRYDVEVNILGGGCFRRSGMPSMEEAEGSVSELSAVMAGCGAAVAEAGTPEAATLEGASSRAVH